MEGKNGEFESPTLVDLFCGAGGLSLGLMRTGFVPILAADHFPAAIDTYSANIGEHAQTAEIAQETELPKATVYVGGPPCQGFSSAGKRRNGDVRNSLVEVFANLIASHRPPAFIFENVEGFLTTEGGRRVLELLDPLIEAGYQIHLRKINAANFGVPQHRKRVIAIGGLGWSPMFPQPTHFAYGAPGASLFGSDLPPAATLIESIGDLPSPTSREVDAPVSDHVSRSLSGTDLERASLLQPGQRMRDLPEALWHPSYAKRANRRVMDGTPTERRGGAPAGVRRLLPGEPSKAITASARSEFIHPFDTRPLTLRECARIQTFPDTFTFHGSVSERATLIGNAVPPLLASCIGRALLHGLRSAESIDDRGKLLTFIPTVSNGMSPALKDITDTVIERYGLRPVEKQKQLWP